MSGNVTHAQPEIGKQQETHRGPSSHALGLLFFFSVTQMSHLYQTLQVDIILHNLPILLRIWQNKENEEYRDLWAQPQYDKQYHPSIANIY